jgi:Tfp pilus assembly pilus retraction ATPase PilT
MMQTGQNVGMQTLDKQLSKFVKDGLITLDAAIEKSINVDDLKRFVSGADGAPIRRPASTF